MKLSFVTSSFFYLSMASAATGPAIDVADGRRIAMQLNYGVGKKIVVVHHPDCHFTQNAFKKISPSFKEALKKRGLFLAPLGSEDDFKKISQWNLSNPKFKTFLVKDTLAWDKIDLNSVPNFYFLEDGNIKCHVKGWPKEGRNREIAECMRNW